MGLIYFAKRNTTLSDTQVDSAILSSGASGTRIDRDENSVCVSRSVHLRPKQPLHVRTSLLSAEWSWLLLKSLPCGSDIACSERLVGHIQLQISLVQVFVW